MNPELVLLAVLLTCFLVSWMLFASGFPGLCLHFAGHHSLL